MLLGSDREGIPAQIAAEMDRSDAAIQTEFGKLAGLGRWVHVPIDNAFLSVQGSTNSWRLGNHLNQYAYTVIGNTMIVSWYFTGSQLSIAVSVDSLALVIPGGYQAAGATGSLGQNHAQVGYGGNGGAYFLASARAGVPDNQHIYLLKVDVTGGAPYFVTDTNFFLAGQVAFEIVPRS